MYQKFLSFEGYKIFMCVCVHVPVCVYHILFISVDGDLGCFYLLPILYNAAVNMGV